MTKASLGTGDIVLGDIGECIYCGATDDLPKLPAPGAMDGRPLSTNVQTHGVVGLRVVANDGGDSNPAKRAGVDAVEIPITYEPVPMMRMLAKIAWGYAVAQYGVNAVEPAVNGVVLGTDHNVAHYVGALDGWTLFDGPATSDIHVCVAVIEQGWVLAGVRLFSNQGAPEYTVVVGRLRSATEAEENGDQVSLGDPAEPMLAPV